MTDLHWVSTYVFAVVYTPTSGADHTPTSGADHAPTSGADHTPTSVILSTPVSTTPHTDIYCGFINTVFCRRVVQPHGVTGEMCTMEGPAEPAHSTSLTSLPGEWGREEGEWVIVCAVVLYRNLLLTSSANGMETVVFNQLQDGWERWELEDSGRAEVPLVNGQETYVAGMSLSLCSQCEVHISE